MIDFEEVKMKIRQNLYRGHTCGLFPEKAQFNVVILPQKYAEDFSTFCKNNKVCCPLVFKSEIGEVGFSQLEDVDIRRDVPAYWIYKNGLFFEERSDITTLWQDDLVVFLIGCSFTFEHSLIKKGIHLKHIEENKNVAMYKTNLQLNSSAFFSGNMVVSMRWIKPDQLDDVVEITGLYENFHGEPVHIGNPNLIGINDLENPDYGEYVESDNDVPVFWGCGVTPQNSLLNSKIPLAVTHKPGSMLISDLDNQQVLAMTNQM